MQNSSFVYTIQNLIMSITQMKPFSANWIQVKQEFIRNKIYFERLSETVKDKNALHLLNNLLSANKACVEAMESLEKKPMLFKDNSKPHIYKRNPPFKEPDESIEE